MIKKYKIGNPINTYSTILDIKIEKTNPNIVLKDGSILISNIKKEDIIYGLGESLHGVNKKGFLYESYTKDEPHHWEDKKGLYGAHNFFIISGEKNIGFFIDNPGYILFDMCFNSNTDIKINIKYPDYYLYIIKANTAYDVVSEFKSLIGKSYLPPKWALGFGQSRWSYKNEAEVLEVLKNHKEKGIGLDSIYLDIDYMDNYKNFTIHTKRFPNLKKLVKTLKKENVHLIPIIDAAVKEENGYFLHDEGVKNNYFCKLKNGENFVCGVWPGYSLLPDFLNSDARKWFSSYYQNLISLGIDGFWNDMNEPSLFYSKTSVNNILEYLQKNKVYALNTILELQAKINTLANNVSDYSSFYHHYENNIYPNDQVHNLFGFNMTKGASEYFKSIGKDILLFSRSSFIGAHRYGGIWQGDNYSCWSHLKLTISQSMSLDMVGFLFNGADIGGFAGDCNEELFTRWLEYSIFSPLCRNHSSIYTKRQEIYSFKNWSTLKNILEIRYSLINYIMNELEYAQNNNKMYLRPLAFDYPNDKDAKEVYDEVLVGRSILICPMYEENKTSRYIYLPEDMLMLRLSSLDNIKEVVIKKGHHHIDVALDEVLIFIKKGHSLSFYNKATSVKESGKTIIKTFKF